MEEIRLIPVKGIPLVNKGDDIASLIVNADNLGGPNISNGDIIVVTHKIVSKSEGALVDLTNVNPSAEAIELAKRTGRDAELVQVYLDEADKILFVKGRIIVTKHRLGYKMSSSGVDFSNSGQRETKIVTLLPRDPDASARKIRHGLSCATGKETAVIIIDSCGRDEREGSIGMAIGIAGISHLEYREQNDLYGNRTRSQIALVDELAAAASMLMGQADEGIPVVIVRGVRYTVDDQASIKNLLNEV